MAAIPDERMHLARSGQFSCGLGADIAGIDQNSVRGAVHQESNDLLDGSRRSHEPQFAHDERPNPQLVRAQRRAEG